MRGIFFAISLTNRLENFLRVLADVKNNSYDEQRYAPKLVADMKSSGCLIDDYVEELERLEFYRNLAKYDATNFGLTIAPTLDCNFRCGQKNFSVT